MPYRVIHTNAKTYPPDAVLTRSWWPPWGRTYLCGHRDAKRFAIRIRGAIIVPRDDDERRCADCVIVWLTPRIIDCPQCAQPIFAGEPVWRFNVDDPKGFTCLRMGCAGAIPTAEHIWRWDGECLAPLTHQ